MYCYWYHHLFAANGNNLYHWYHKYIRLVSTLNWFLDTVDRKFTIVNCCTIGIPLLTLAGYLDVGNVKPRRDYCYMQFAAIRIGLEIHFLLHLSTFPL